MRECFCVVPIRHEWGSDACAAAREYASEIATRAAARRAQAAPPPRSPLVGRRDNLIRYLNDNVDAEDWHAVSDAANDLRELDVEIRMAK